MSSKRFEHAELYGLKPINRDARIITGQSGVTGGFELVSAKLQREVKIELKRLSQGPRKDRDHKRIGQLSHLSTKVKQRRRKECDLLGIGMGDPYLVLDHENQFLYADHVGTLNHVGFRGLTYPKVFFAIVSGLPSGKQPFYARRSWPD